MLNRQGLFNPADRQRREQRSFDAPVANQPPTPVEPARAETSKPDADTPAPRPKVEETKGSRLIVGPDIKLKGAEITDCDTLVVEGRVEASMDSRVMQIAENGSFHGTVGVDIAEIRGRFDGELTCRKQLVIHPTGKVSGKIRYGRIVIEEGGEVAGDVAALGTQKAAVLASTAKPVEAAAR
ncbi:MAG TPA: polymer-forming cytoskeletal protein [Burkholderiales bacterium]|nr:polymer-forming cytoskeletal protein [Burkholderiales bacterium]